MDERTGGTSRILFVEFYDERGTQSGQSIFFVEGLQRVRKIGHESEVQIPVPIGQVPNLQIFDCLSYLLVGKQQEKRDEGAALLRYSSGEIEPGEPLGFKGTGNQEIRDCDCTFHNRKQGDQQYDRESPHR